MRRPLDLVTNKLALIDRLVYSIVDDRACYGTFSTKEDDGVFYISTHFHKIPFKHGSNKAKKICIFINGRIEVETSNKDITLRTYNTEISYLTIEDRSAPYTSLKPLTGFHFDYEGLKENHPVFHGQHKTDTFERFLKDNSNFACVEDYEVPPYHGSIRIPTSQMDPVSALVMIVADHIVDPKAKDCFVNFLDAMKKLIIPMSASICKAEISKGNSSPRIGSWYPT